MINSPLFHAHQGDFPCVPAAGEAHVWFLQKNTPFNPVLSPAPGGAAISDARKYIQWLLSGYLKKDYSFMNICRNEHGKPRVEGLEFTLSHSQNMALFAFAQVPVGIDLEFASRSVRSMEIARRYYLPEESRQLAQFGEEDQKRLFLRMWTAKEASVKLSGLGLAQGLHDVKCDFSGSSPAATHQGQKVFLQEFSLPEGGMGTLAAWQPLRVNFFSLP